MFGLSLWLAMGARAAEPSEAPAPVVSRVVWGKHPFPVEGVVVDVVFDRAGRPCAVDDGGVVCFDEDGEPDWALDLPGVDEVVEAAGYWALRVGEEIVVVDDANGQVRARSSDAWAARTANGRLILMDQAGFGPVEAAPVSWNGGPGPVAGVLAREDGGLGLIRPDGSLTWVGPGGEVEADLDLGLSAEGGVLAEPLADGGFVVLDDAGVVLLDPDGAVRAEVALPGSDLSVYGNELWVATEDGVWGVDPRTGAVDAIPEAPPATSVVAQDSRLVTGAGRRLRVWDEDQELAGSGHLGPVHRLAPGPGGTLASVDLTGRAVVWTASGEPRVLPWPGVRDISFVGAQIWVALGDRTIAVASPGQPAREVGGAATWLVPLPDGVVIGDGRTLRRVDRSGKVQWTVVSPHDRRPTLAFNEGILLVVGASVDVVDLENGVRRRRMYEPGAAAAGVAVGGLVVWAEDPLGTLVIRPTSTRSARLSGRRVVPSPEGRWAVSGSGRTLFVEDGEGRRLFQADTVAAPYMWATDAEHVWVGLEDGRIERWNVAGVVVDAAPPPFEAYAQLDPWKAPSPGGKPSATWNVGAGARRVVAGEAGAAAVLGAGLVTLQAGKLPQQVILPDGVLATSLAWDAELGFVVGAENGRLVTATGDNLGAATGAIRDLCRVPSGWMASGTALELLPDEGPGAAWPVPSLRIACDPTALNLALRRAEVALVGTVGENAWTSLRHAGTVRAVAWADEGFWATGGEDEVVILWDRRSLSPAYVLEGHGAPVTALASARGRLMAAAADRVFLWDLTTLRAITTWSLGHDVVDVTLSADGRSAFALDQRGQVARWDLPEPAQTQEPDLEGIPKFDVVPPPTGLPAR